MNSVSVAVAGSSKIVAGNKLKERGINGIS